MYQQFRPGGFQILPNVVKNLMIINGLFFLATVLFENRFNMVGNLGLFYWGSSEFKIHQFATHIFMHGGLGHLFSNMFMLWMFGSVLENIWGGKRFLIYYLVTALGAAVLHNLVKTYEVWELSKNVTPETFTEIKERGFDILMSGKNYTDETLGGLNMALNTPTVGASGAVFGVLLAFGMLFPNTEIYLYFLFPLKAKYFVIGYGVLELYLGLANNPTDNIAHFAHLGGMLFGFFMIRYWNRNKRNTFY